VRNSKQMMRRNIFAIKKPAFPKPVSGGRCARGFCGRVLAVAAICVIFLVAFASAQSKPVWRFAVNPWGEEKLMRAMLRPLMDYFEEKLGVKIEVVIPSNYEELLKGAAGGEFDLMAFNSVSFLKARHKGLPVRYLASIKNQQKGEAKPRDFYEGFIIARKDSSIKTFDDLRGKTFAFVDVDSGSGYKMPVAILGIDYHTTPDKFFKKFFFVGEHDEVASAVYNRCVDAGATWDTSLALNIKKYGNVFHIVKRTPPIPNDAWVTGPRITEEQFQKLKKLMLSIGPDTLTRDGRRVLDREGGFPGTGWNERDVAFYEDAAKYLLYDENK
jgi:phosphonate transport system substrate-binding protein